MGLPSKVLHGLLAVLIAVPFGPGGLCCCVISSGCADAETSGAESRQEMSSCCAADWDATSAAEGRGCPASREASPRAAAGCECPSRDEVVGAAAPSDLRGPLTSLSDLGALPEAQPAVSVAEPAPSVALVGVLPPPPKLPLHRKLAVILC